VKAPRKPRPRTSEQIAREFVHAHLGRGAFAPLTGTDWRAWRAFVHLVELWGVSRDPNALAAMRSCLACAQGEHEDVMQVFVQTIPAMLDWSDHDRLWPAIAPDTDVAHRLVPIHGDGAL
jgi:hypothetical protein